MNGVYVLVFVIVLIFALVLVEFISDVMRPEHQRPVFALSLIIGSGAKLRASARWS